METTEPMSMDQAVDAMIQPEQPTEEVTEEVVEETESQSDVENTTEPDDEQPVTDSEDEGEEVEDTADDAEEESEDDTEEETEAEDNQDEVDESESEDPASQLYTVKVDGEEKQVTLDELTRGYSGQKYVQKGMQEAAQQRKQAEDVYATLLQERQNLAQLMNQVQQGALTPPTEPSRELFDSDPIGYMEAKMDYDQKVKVFDQHQQQLQHQMAQQSAAEQKARDAYAAHEAAKLREAVPELADPVKSEAFKRNIVEAAEHYGYTAEEIQGISSHRDMMVLRDAMRYRQLQAKGDIVREKTKKARKPIKPSAKKVITKAEAQKKQRDKLRQSGSLFDAAAMLLDPNVK